MNWDYYISKFQPIAKASSAIKVLEFMKEWGMCPPNRCDWNKGVLTFSTVTNHGEILRFTYEDSELRIQRLDGDTVLYDSTEPV